MTALLLFVLAQGPSDVPVALVVSSRRDNTGAAAHLVESLKASLESAHISAMSESESVKRLTQLGGVDPKACDGARLCLQKLAQLLQGVVVGVDVSRAGKRFAAHVEAVSFDRVESLAVDDLAAESKTWRSKSLEVAASFAVKLRAPLAALNESRNARGDSALRGFEEFKTPPSPEPLVSIALVPPPTAPAQAVLSPPPQAPAQKRGLLPYFTGGGGVVSAGVGAALLVLGFVDRGTYSSSLQMRINGQTTSRLSDRELSDLAGRSNTFIITGGILVGLGAALGITTLLLFL
jgi:hypothetical protein